MAAKPLEPLQLTLDRIETPVGTVLLVVDAEGAVRALDFSGYEERMLRLLRRHYGEAPLTDGRAPEPARGAVAAYFAGDLTAFDRLVVKTAGTEFQRAVWAALRKIPAGQTLTYGQLAAAIGNPKAVRAAGLANGQNPIALIVPCHRVIGANGTLTGFAGGLERKRWLLDHEAQASSYRSGGQCGLAVPMPESGFQIRIGDLTDPRIVALLETHLAGARAHSPPGSVHALDLSGLQGPGLSFWALWDGDEVVGLGALKTLDAGHGEVKSMHTAKAARGRGAGTQMLRHIIVEAKARGLERLSLETGMPDYFHPAHALYRRHGFVECPPFGAYVADGFSLCMTRELID